MTAVTRLASQRSGRRRSRTNRCAVGVEDLMAQREHRLIDGERARGEVAQGARRSSTGGYVPAGNVLSTPV